MLRAKQRLGKYRIEGKIGSGGFAEVYRAYDTIEGIRVALKIPHARMTDAAMLEAFKHEARMAARLDHPNILPIKNAGFVDERFVIAYPLGQTTLAERMRGRLAFTRALGYVEQMLEALAHAHARRVIHCDIKPENFLVFEGDRLRLADFGIAKVARRTVKALGTGTIGYCAPEQAMGRPSPRSDVFSLGLVFYQLFTGKLPQWPFAWPGPGHDRLRRVAHPALIALIRRCLEIDSSKRHPDAARLLAAFKRLKPRILAHATRSRSKKRGRSVTDRHWQEIRRRQFRREFGKVFDCRHDCEHCGGPVGEFMAFCPWCRADRKKHEGDTSFPQICPRCHRGMKLDWSYCSFCYGHGFEASTRHYPDRRYTEVCENADCAGPLMPFSRYCPWCRKKQERAIEIEGVDESCDRCGSSMAASYWACCPFCGAAGKRPGTD